MKEKNFPGISRTCLRAGLLLLLIMLGMGVVSGYAQECARRSLPSYAGPLFDAMAQIDEGES